MTANSHNPIMRPRVSHFATIHLALLIALSFVGCSRGLPPSQLDTTSSASLCSALPDTNIRLSQIKPFEASQYPDGVQLIAYMVDQDHNVVVLHTPLVLRDHNGQQLRVFPDEFEKLLTEKKIIEMPAFDPQKLGEGEFASIRSEAFLEFSDNGPRKAAAFEKDLQSTFQEAFRTGRSSPIANADDESGFGPSAPDYFRALLHPITAQWTFFLTAREHAPSTMHDAWKKALSTLTEAQLSRIVPTKYWPKRRGKEPITLYLPPVENFVGVAYVGDEPRLTAQSQDKSPFQPTRNVSTGQQKFEAIKMILQNMSRIRFATQSVEVTDVDGRPGVRHLAGFSDDSASNLKGVIEGMRNMPKDDDSGHILWSTERGSSSVILTLFPKIPDKVNHNLTMFDQTTRSVAPLTKPVQLVRDQLLTFALDIGAGSPSGNSATINGLKGNRAHVMEKWPSIENLSHLLD